ncbi:MAG: preprotein translocase subunit SecA [Betaproteobacteria bacterium]|nr:preprotein translocase subunit SecA [Betaproteobacteria bacterium]
MSDTAVLRPGIALGPYPQREDLRDSWLDRAAASLGGFIRQRAYGRSPGHRAFLALVNAEGQRLSELADPAIRDRVPELRRRLYSEGLQEALVARTFAIVREIAGRRLGMRPFDVQLLGGRVMLEGKIAEMETGEGKTLAATLPACAAALAGIPVHIVTVNDFLVMRDAAWMNPIYKFFGLSVGTITEGMTPEARRSAYACDITYGTNKQVVFDYLKDRLMLGRDARPMHLQMEGLHAEHGRARRLLLRGLCFVIVDEADSVLIDEARTPLIISNVGDSSQEERVYTEAVAIARQLTTGVDFSIRPREHDVELSERGRHRATELAEPYGGVWMGPRRREELMRRALSALYLFQRDKQYLVRGGKVQIVDEYTGRVMPDRSWERGLHQMIEAKEGCAITGQQETLARISYQRFFRRYLRVAGMTGTAREVARELWAVYRLPVVSIPTNRPVRRRRLPDEVYITAEEKWAAIVETLRRFQAEGRPVLVGTRSVSASEHLSELLSAGGLAHQVLNARQDQEEAEVIGRAGERGRITVATNMAGRGTDIRLAPGVAELGGLHVLATERHDARRIDRQLFGRGGRQGDPGSFQVIVSLEDEIVHEYFKGHAVRLGRLFLRGGRPFPHWLGRLLVGIAQRGAERHHGRARRELLRIDEQLSDLLAFTGRGE